MCVPRNVSGASWQGSFAELAKMVQHLQRAQLTGRLSLRNIERAGLVHLYFRVGRLVHMAGHRGNVEAMLVDIQAWRQAALRFDREVISAKTSLNEEHEQLLARTLSLLVQWGIIVHPPLPIAPFYDVVQSQASSQDQPQEQVSKPLRSSPRKSTSKSSRPLSQKPVEPLPPPPQKTVESSPPLKRMLPVPLSQTSDRRVIAVSEVKELISLEEWRVLVEGVRRVSFAVAHLVGPQEALQALSDIIDDCAASFPAFANVTISPGGYLQITDQVKFDLLSRKQILEGFAALITICQYFCSPIIGEREAHQLMRQALMGLEGSFVRLGVFAV